MNVHQLRRWSDNVDGETLRRWSDKAGSGLKASGQAAKNGFNNVYSTAMNSPKASVAVVLGAGVAAAVVWLVKRNGTFASRRKQTLERVRTPAKRSRRTRATS